MTRARETLVSLEATPTTTTASPAVYAVPGCAVKIPIPARDSSIGDNGCWIDCGN
jgi:hypothetical protein